MNYFEQAHLLLCVHEKAMGYPKLKAIADNAMAELESMILPQKEIEPELPLKPVSKMEKRV